MKDISMTLYDELLIAKSLANAARNTLRAKNNSVILAIHAAEESYIKWQQAAELEAVIEDKLRKEEHERLSKNN